MSLGPVPRLLVHVGLPKTETQAIQRYMYARREAQQSIGRKLSHRRHREIERFEVVGPWICGLFRTESARLGG